MFSELPRRDIWLCIFAVEWNFASFADIARAVDAWSRERELPLLDHLRRSGAISEEAKQALDDLMHHRPATFVVPRQRKATLQDLRRVQQLRAQHRERLSLRAAESTVAK